MTEPNNIDVDEDELIKRDDDTLGYIIDYLVRWIIATVVIKSLPKNLTNINDITKVAFTLGIFFALLEVIMPDITNSVKDNILLILAIKILTM